MDKNAFALRTWEERGSEYINRLMRDLHLTAEQAAGLVGNLGHESAGFSTMQEIRPMVDGTRGGFGIAQWTGPRRDAFEAWCSMHGVAASSDAANYGFLLDELRGSYRSFTAKLKRCATIEAASRLTHRLYETPADVLDGSYRSSTARLAWGRRALTGIMPGKPLPEPVEPAEPAVPRPVDPALVADLVRALQRVVGVTPDGILGPQTAAAITQAQR